MTEFETKIDLAKSLYEKGDFEGSSRALSQLAYHVREEGKLKSWDEFQLTPETPIEEVKPYISGRTFNCLFNEGYKTWGEVLLANEKELLRIPNFGKSSIDGLDRVRMASLGGKFAKSNKEFLAEQERLRKEQQDKADAERKAWWDRYENSPERIAMLEREDQLIESLKSRTAK